MAGWNRGVESRTTDGLAPVRDVDYQYTGYLVRRTYDPFRGSSRQYVWTDDAACNGEDPEIFTIKEMSELDGGSPYEVRQLNMANIEKAQTICEDCPVKKKCLDSADSVDLHWSVRGGQLPLRIADKKPDRKIHVPSWDMRDFSPAWVGCPTHGHASPKTRTRKGSTITFCGACGEK